MEGLIQTFSEGFSPRRWGFFRSGPLWDEEAIYAGSSVVGAQRTASAPKDPSPIQVVGEEKLLLAIVSPVSPSLPREVAAEEASHLFGSWLPAVEKPSRGEVVCLIVDYELLVRSEGLAFLFFWAML